MKKPECRLIGTDGNVFALIGKASKALKRADMRDEAKAMADKCMAAGSYDEALRSIMSYVEVR